MGEDEDDYYGSGDGYDGYGSGDALARAAAEEEFESSDRRPWTDLIPRFRVKVEPMTTLKLRKRFYPFKTVIELGADYNTQVRGVVLCWGSRWCACSTYVCALSTDYNLSTPTQQTDRCVAVQELVGGPHHRRPPHRQGPVRTYIPTPIIHPPFPTYHHQHIIYTHPPHTRELQFSKTWLVTLGDQDDIATRLKFRAGIDTGTWRSYARLGFRCVCYTLCVGGCVAWDASVVSTACVRAPDANPSIYTPQQNQNQDGAHPAAEPQGRGHAPAAAAAGWDGGPRQAGGPRQPMPPRAGGAWVLMLGLWMWVSSFPLPGSCCVLDRLTDRLVD